MEIYVQSRGRDRDKDYRWVRVLPDNSVQAQLPPLSTETIALIHNESPSIVIDRLQDNRLLLLLTKIQTSDRVDFLARPIRIDLVWVGENTEEHERSLRYLAARALNTNKLGLLAREISAAVTLLKDPESIKIKNEYLDEIKALWEIKITDRQDFTIKFQLDTDVISRFLNGQPIHYKKFVTICNALELGDRKIEEIHQPLFDDLEIEVRGDALEYGFQVSHSNLIQLLEVPDSKSFSNIPPNTTPKIGKNIPPLCYGLAEELQKYSLPSQQGALIVVTGFKQRETLEQAKIWRSLSKLIETEGDVWENVSVLPEGEWENYWKTVVQMPFSLFKLVMESIQKALSNVADRAKLSGDRETLSDSSDRQNDNNSTGRS
ncbi:MAG: hypothetical protein J7647_10080 [Cyanobacteria bacterium SBLK]|nr:hypothetical protein [Cyanobacteria bacterium SBLK]